MSAADTTRPEPGWELAETFEQATSARINDDDIERRRLVVGIDTAIATREHGTTATPDAIRAFTEAVGDDNPLYVDDDHGRATRWGGQER